MDSISSRRTMGDISEYAASGMAKHTGDDDSPAVRYDGVELSETASALKDKKICIDPGHGGGDSGAVGPTKFTEKEANLDIALNLRRYLESKGARVIMTRDTDTSLTSSVSGVKELGARVKVANESKADVFVSIHNNASDNSATGGTETYYYAKGSAASKLLARTVFDHQVEKLGLHPRGTFPAKFYVIKYTDMPAVLSESAFVSNAEEEAKLKDPAFRHTVAEAIGDGIEEYFVKMQGGSIDSSKPNLPDDGKWDPLPCEKYLTVAQKSTSYSSEL
ncbi:MAG: N-acetylmuramoyl-L-alanine amidase [Candidatus Eremiobacteraeota bacterium]|nr:N-acetylmuramoyl-L-alanine amidase [Candidatus Eremiobacteraeota bacterium]